MTDFNNFFWLLSSNFVQLQFGLIAGMVFFIITIPIIYIITTFLCLSQRYCCRYDVEAFVAHRFLSTGVAVSLNNHMFIALCCMTSWYWLNKLIFRLFGCTRFSRLIQLYLFVKGSPSQICWIWSWGRRVGQHKNFSPRALSSFRKPRVLQPESWRSSPVLPGNLGQKFPHLSVVTGHLCA